MPDTRDAVKYVPTTWHLVAASNGSGRVEEENVLKQIANLNNTYADQEFVFYIDRFNYFDNDAVYNTPHSAAARTQMNLRRDNNSVNFFIVNTANDQSDSPGEVLAYYDPSGDWIVSKKGEVNGSSHILDHETGHFSTLHIPLVVGIVIHIQKLNMATRSQQIIHMNATAAADRL